MISPTPASSSQPGAVVPRSASLALWLWASSGQPEVDERALRTLVDDDEPHEVRPAEPGDLPAELGSRSLAALFALWSGKVSAVTAVFPGPGDALGVPTSLSAQAVEAEECVLVTVEDQAWALAPDVVPFGSVLEQGFMVTWDVARIEPWENRALGVVGSLAEAQRELQNGLREATEALMELDVSRWREDASAVIAALRDPVDLRHLLPSGLDPRRVQVFQSAARLRAIVDLATTDDGGAVNVWQADQRSAALREVDRGARRAMSAATLHTPTSDR